MIKPDTLFSKKAPGGKAKRIFLILAAVIAALSITARTNAKAAEPGVQAVTTTAESEEKTAAEENEG